MDILTLLRAARWLTTGQIHRRFFENATLGAARKRLRALEKGKYIFRYRQNRMAESLITLGVQGKRIVESRHEGEVKLQRRPPKQAEHLIGINDVRIAAELLPDLQFFFACWELPAISWRNRLIPDAVFGLANETFAVEFDRGEESLQFFVKTKIEVYRRGLDGFPLRAVMVIADTEQRMRNLMKATVAASTTSILFSTIDLVRTGGLASSIFLSHMGRPTCISQPVASGRSVDRRSFNF